MRYASNPSCAFTSVCPRRDRIQRFQIQDGEGTPSSDFVANAPTCSSENRVAFQTLFKKRRYPSTRFGARAIRLFVGGYVDSVKRTASAPNVGKPVPIVAADG